MNVHERVAARWAVCPEYREDVGMFATDVVPFRQPGPFERWKGPWKWQQDFFDSLSAEMREKDWGAVGPDGTIVPKPPINRVICSATGSGKTAFVLPLVILHQLATQPAMKVICISPSREQLRDKLAGAVKSIIEASPRLRKLFTYAESGKVSLRSDPANSFAVFRTAGQIEALQGTHSASGIVAVVIDEASGVPDALWEATAGARGDPCCTTILSGNPWRLDGFFGDRHSGRLAESWKPVFIPADTLPTWVEERREDLILERGGVDSTEYRATVLAKPPLAGSNAFIPRSVVEDAMNRPLLDQSARPVVPADTPLVAGVDLAREGEANNCAVFRAGKDARSIGTLSITGHDLPPKEKVAWLIDIATLPRPPYGPPVVVFLDGTGLDGQLLWDLRRTGHGHKFIPVDFSAADPAGRCRNLRAVMWSGLRAWLYEDGRLRYDTGLLRTITAARGEYERERLTITPKDEIAARAGRTHLDEVDALLLALLDPPESMLRYREPALPRPVQDGTTWAG